MPNLSQIHSHNHNHQHGHNTLDSVNNFNNLNNLNSLNESSMNDNHLLPILHFEERYKRKPTPEEINQLLMHGHTHEHLDHAGYYEMRNKFNRNERDLSERSFTIGIGGPVGSGKTALMLQLCKSLRDTYSIAAVTNDIFTREDGEFLVKNKALSSDRIQAIETGGCPHAAIREDISANLQACEEMTHTFQTNMILVESGGDNLAANFSRELADFIIYVIDVAGGDKVPRKGGPGITQADLLVINKIDLAPYVGADLDVMKRDALKMRGNDAPTVFTQINAGVGKEEIIKHILEAYEDAINDT